MLCWQAGGSGLVELDFPPLLFGKLLARLLTAEIHSQSDVQCSLIAALLPITCVYRRNSPLVSSEVVALVMMVARLKGERKRTTCGEIKNAGSGKGMVQVFGIV